MVEPDILYIKCHTFRRHIQVFIGGDKEYYDKEKLNTISEYVDEGGGLAYYDGKNHCYVIWLEGYQLDTLCHEITHICQMIIKYIGLEYEGEPMAYMFEEIFVKILLQSKNKFKISKDNTKFFGDE